MKTSSKRRVAVAAVFILLALFLFRPGASRLKSRIITSMSAAIGRPVDIGSVHIQLLPRPGFDLENLVVYDDPAFGGEPILRASEVTAALRITSLFRGRLEIARLDLTEPSLNLVHGENGRWNLEALLERTARLPLAPTAKAKTEPRPGFPYIEASSARINFKSGNEKKPFALTSADFSLWQDSENSWGVRLKAQPFRTDVSLNDMGTLQVNGTWQRAPTLRETPLQFEVGWRGAQLGQFTKFLAGSDKGWRGEIRLDVALEGTPEKLRASSSASIEDFRRYDIASGTALRLAGHCDGEYSSATHDFHEVICSAPVGQGLITLTGDLGLPGSHRYAVIVRAENVPAAAAAAMLARAKKNLPDDLEAEGTVRGDFSLQADAAAGSEPKFEGHGEIDEFKLASASNKAEIGPLTVPFAIAEGQDTPGIHTNHSRVRGPQLPGGPHIDLGPFALGSGRASSPTIRGWINRSGYNLSIAGETDVARILRLGRMIGMPVPVARVEGSAQLDLQIAGPWIGPGSGSLMGFSGPQATGTAKLKNVQVMARGLGGPVEIVSADMQLLPEQSRVTRLNAKVAGTNWSGSLEMPRGCGLGCPVRFALNANQIVLSELSEWASPGSNAQPWYRVLGADAGRGPSVLTGLHASGRISADQLAIHGLVAKHASANVSLEAGKLRLSEVNAEFMAGKHHGEWEADFSMKPAVCKGAGTFSAVSLAGFATAMDDNWIAGTANGSYEISGKCPAEFWQMAKGTLNVDMRDSIFPHVSIAGSSDPLRVTRLTGRAELKEGKIKIDHAQLESPETQYELSGSASEKRELDLKLTRVAGGGSGTGYSITGTLSRPRIAASATTEQARLKPPPAK